MHVTYRFLVLTVNIEMQPYFLKIVTLTEK